jgi:hypothetical protein
MAVGNEMKCKFNVHSLLAPVGKNVHLMHMSEIIINSVPRKKEK